MGLLSASDEGPGRRGCPLGCQQSNMMMMGGRPLCLSIVGMCTAPTEISRIHVKSEEAAHLYGVIINGVDAVETKSDTNKHDNCASTPT
jgi:hypothetical protein